MRAAFIVLLVFVSGFDHGKHETATKQSIACASCHPVTKTALLVGKPGHATCFGKCHGPAPVFVQGKKLVIDAPRMKVCTTCHTQTALDGTDRKAFATRTAASTPDFALAIGHKRHAAVACAQCHAQTKTTHARCAGCHDGAPKKGPPMALCSGCHLSAATVQQAPAEVAVLVRTAFSHGKHAARGGSGAKCATCHTGVSDTDARTLPHPTVKTCAAGGCHDAKAAFSTIAQCTRCHQDVPVGKFDVARPPNTFSHADHLAYLAWVPCSTCHPVGKSGEVGLADHASCAPCHEDDFGSREPTTCGACHDATEPWRKLLPERPSLPTSEFGASLDHGKHQGTCASCHSLTTTTTELRPPRGHRACTGKTCHSTTAPTFDRCSGCHDWGLSDRRQAQRATARWSVRRQFVHTTHEKAKDGTALACASCHLDMAGADLLSVKTPPKSTCAPCHDGSTSFKLTGTACTRCHQGAKKP